VIRTLIEGFVLGYSTGSVCLVTCTPIYLPYLLTEDRKLSKSLFKITEISLGRFFSYLTFGAVAGYAGSNIATFNRQIFTSIAYILLSFYLIFSAYRTHRVHKKCYVPKALKFTKNAFVLGVLTGINFCPSFLIALSKAINLGGAFSGMFLFLGFFFGTTLFLIPLAFANLLTKIKGMKSIAQIASLLIAGWFIWQGIQGIYQWQQHRYRKIDDPKQRTVELFREDQTIFILSQEKNKAYFESLRFSFHKATPDSLNIVLFTDVIDWNQIMAEPKSLLLIDSDFSENIPNYKRFDHILIDPDYKIETITNFLKKYTFQTDSVLEWKFENKEKEK
jgi:sulfite exporter TauE/SafE